MGAREQMIDAGEELAATRGMASMSLREVQAASGQRNKSAAQYHFGDRHGLIEAIAAARMGPINEARRVRLDELGDEPTVRELVEILVEPLAEATLRPGSCWARFLAQTFTDPELSEVVRRSFEAGPYRDVRTRLIAAGPAPEALRERRVDHAIGVLVMSLAAAETVAASGRRSAVNDEAQIGDLVDICTAIVEAPASPTTLAALASGSRRTA